MENQTGILIYQTEDGNTKIDVKLEKGTVWMTQKAIADLYQKGVNTINEHVKHIYEGQRKVEREVSFYNLEVIM